MKIIARKKEVAVLRDVVATGRPEFLAVYGRRRIGKTYLVRNFFRDESMFFHITGTPGQNTAQQLWNFTQVYADVFHRGRHQPTPRTWPEALNLLRKAIEAHGSQERIVLFFDELPWLATRKSGFVEALSHLWNRYLEADPRVIVVVCGSAASWMIKHVIDSRGGLHNRTTRRLHLKPLNLHDAEIYLHEKGVRLSRKQIVEVYMAVGGVPAYLDNVRPGRSSAQIIAEICFEEQSPLYGEFDRIFRSMFNNSEQHTRVIRELTGKRSGITRRELFSATRITSGSVQNRVERELIESGFIARSPQFGAKKKGAIIRLIDEYVIFYLTWRDKMQNPEHAPDQTFWRSLQRTNRWHAWSGYAFEGICRSHAKQIAKALGFHGINYSCHTWHSRAGGGDRRGAQVDIVLDRADHCINLCEVKFHDTDFTMTHDYSRQLIAKREAFVQATKTRKTVFTTMITCHGVKENSHYHEAVDSQLMLDALYETV
jgi:uncharacterized protein